ncbi:Phycobilisome Linker polypeptide domain protein [Synechococcus sp. PCC 7335]|nr:phycobilisome rod-core linker polypeptide [Synechococcus sp. PCC 7335]EDX86552.1 Phycobilisome Linker polypeptide domain protein [Synechococcus sp. PCC 7335]
MSLPLLSYPVSSQNQRVPGFEVPGDEQPYQYSTDRLLSGQELDNLILAAYRRIFNEQQVLASTRERSLESQLAGKQITVRDFIKGLLLSDTFRRRNYECNNNYRFVQMCIQRVLGRDVYDNREKLAWSTVLATKGLEGFVTELLESDEYLDNFGLDTVPYQRRRILAQHTTGELPFERMPRYGQDYLAQLEALGNDFSSDRQVVEAPYLRPSATVLQIAGWLTKAGGVALAALVLAVVLSWFGWISL